MRVSFLSILVFTTLLFGMLILASGAEGPSAGKIFKGYLSDAACGTSLSGKAADGTDMLKQPQNHTVACMRADACIASGFGLMIKGKTGTYSFVKFDAAGSDQAKNIVMNTRKTKSITLEIEGEMKNNTLTVSGMKELKWADGKQKKK